MLVLYRKVSLGQGVTVLRTTGQWFVDLEAAKIVHPLPWTDDGKGGYATSTHLLLRRNEINA